MHKKLLILFSLFSILKPSPVSVTDGGLGVSSLTAYAVLITGTTTFNPVQQVSGVGTATQVLTANGTGSLPSWQADGNTGTSNGCVFIKTVTASNSASLSFSSADLSSTYKVFMIVLNNLQPSTTASLIAYWSTDDGSSLLSSGYSSGINAAAYTGTSFSNTNSSTFMTIGTSISDYTTGILYLYGANGALTSGPSLIGISVSGYSTMSFNNVIASISGNPTINYMQFKFSSGNINSGSISLYGLP